MKRQRFFQNISRKIKWWLNCRLSRYKRNASGSRWSLFVIILMTACLLFPGCGPKEPFIETIAGSERGFNNATGVTAQFDAPIDIAVDTEGIVYVADSANHVIRMIMPDGEVTTYAGSGRAGYSDGSALEAIFSTPTGIAIDLSGNLYVADCAEMDPHPMRVRAISTDMDVTTLAGSGEMGYKDAVGKDARFKVPANVAVDSEGNVYVADTNNHRIRRITPGGKVTTIAGKLEAGYSAGFVDGNASEARFNGPRGVAVTEGGNVYIADTGNHAIRLITPEGQVSTLAGDKEPGFLDGMGTKARFSFPADVAVDNEGNVYVADTANHAIRMITPKGEVTTLAGTGEPGNVDGSPSEAQFWAPEGITVNQEGFIFVADTGNHRIRKITLP
jgi:sugar lactone lactonase YvrE